MARRRQKRKNKTGQIIVYAIAIILLCFLFFQSDVNLSLGENLQKIFSGTQVGAEDASFKPDNTGKFMMYTINTGNSDSILLISPGGQSMLVDAGEDDDYSTIHSVLDKYNVDTLTAMVETHPHADHIGSMDEILSDTGTGTLYMSKYAADSQSYNDLISAVQTTGTSVQYATSGMQFSLGDASVKVLNPEDKEYDSANNASVVLFISYGETDFLLAGDMEKDAIADVLSSFDDQINCEVLKIAHHGSRTGTTKDLLTETTPELAIITSGLNNDYGHPHAETLDLLSQSGAKVLRTDLLGDIAVLTDGATIQTFTQAAQ